LADSLVSQFCDTCGRSEYPIGLSRTAELPSALVKADATELILSN